MCYGQIMKKKVILFVRLFSLTLDSSWLSVHLRLADSQIRLYCTCIGAHIEYHFTSLFVTSVLILIQRFFPTI